MIAQGSGSVINASSTYALVGTSGRDAYTAAKDAHLLGFVDPLDVAHAVLYLAFDDSRSTTGHILAVDSGLTGS